MLTNVQKLVTQKMARDAIPDGGGVAAGVTFLSDPQKIKRGLADATKWVHAAINEIRFAPEPNPYKHLTDEQIAGVIMDKIREKRLTSRQP